MLWPVLIAGFLLGTAGSLHCIGMCGPLSLALPVYHLRPVQKFISLLFYQFGRIITYSLLGLIVGLAGRRVYIAGYQQAFSIMMGLLVLSMTTLYFLRKRTIHLSFLNRFYMQLQVWMGKLLKSRGKPGSFLLMGMANGLLPCGMIYVALAATFSFTTITDSISFMAMFGLGTLPAMMLVGYAGQMIRPGYRASLKKMVPVFISIMGVVLILRGMNLGIPFISPGLPQITQAAVSCHP